MASQKRKGKEITMEKLMIAVTNEQTERSKARSEAIESLEYNPMCYNCKNFNNTCNGSKNKIYDGCIYKVIDDKKPSIYVQIYKKIK